MNYLQLLVEDIHSTIVSTIGEDGHPQVRAADMMLWDEGGVYFLTAEGKAFYRQLIEQGFLALAGVKDGRAVSLRGKVRCIGQDRLDDIFAAAPYMREIYPEGKRGTLRVFVIYEATGEYFDTSDPSHVVRDDVVIGGAGGDAGTGAAGGTVGGAKTYHVTDGCTGCGACLDVCPQSCIDVSGVPAVVDQHRCLHCGACVHACPVGAIVYA